MPKVFTSSKPIALHTETSSLSCVHVVVKGVPVPDVAHADAPFHPIAVVDAHPEAVVLGIRRANADPNLVRARGTATAAARTASTRTFASATICTNRRWLRTSCRKMRARALQRDSRRAVLAARLSSRAPGLSALRARRPASDARRGRARRRCDRSPARLGLERWADRARTTRRAWRARRPRRSR